ncbi:MAG: hypothetical protein MUF54_07585 [Polyangiaceae bacterium]|jgi:hypothetical protein|nr:hypothetical protein [Polyangiaceae bacterium]
MSILFSGPKRSVEERWIVFALLRDNVQHHLEAGSPKPEFQALHRVISALGGGVTSVPAVQLHAEMVRARDALVARPIADLAISLRTRSVLTMDWPPPDRRETYLLADVDVTLPLLQPEAKTLGDLFGQFVDELIDITAGASDSDVVEIRDL